MFDKIINKLLKKNKNILRLRIPTNRSHRSIITFYLSHQKVLIC